MNLRKFTNFINSSKNLNIGLGLSMLFITAASQVHGLSQQNQKNNPNSIQSSQMMTNNFHKIEPITIKSNGTERTIAITKNLQYIASVSSNNTIVIRDASTNKLIKTLTGHKDLVNQVFWSPDGKFLFSASKDKTIKLWNVSTGNAIATISGYSGKVEELAWIWSPDSKMIAIANLNPANSNQTIQIWNPTTGKLTKTLTSKDKNKILRMIWNTRGTTLAVQSTEDKIQLWDTNTGKLTTTITSNQSKISTISWNPNGKTLAVWSQDKKIQLWDNTTGQLLQTIAGYDGKFEFQRLEKIWSPDGNAIALANQNTIKIWDANTGKLLQTLDHKFTSSVVALTGFNWSPDSKKIVSTSVAGTVVWDVITGKRLQEIGGIYVVSAVWSPDGKSIAIGGQEQKITIFNPTTGKSQILSGHGFFVTNFAWTPDSKILISVGLDNTIKIWDTTTGKRMKTLAGHDGGIIDIRWNPQTKILASTGYHDNTIKLWNIDLNNLVTNKLIQDKEISAKINFPAHKSSITSLVWSPDGKALASVADESLEDGDRIKFWDATTGKSLNILSENQKMTISNIAWNPNGKTFATTGREKIVKKVSGNSSLPGYEIEYGNLKLVIWDASTGKPLRTIDEDKGYHLAWSPDGKTLAISGDRNIQLRDATTGKLLQSIDGSGILAWSPDGKTLTGRNADTMKLWDVSTGKLIKTLTGFNRKLSDGGGETGNMLGAIAWSRDGKFIATTDVSRTIQIWDVTTGKFVKSLSGHGSAVLDVVWSDDSKTLTSVSQDKTIKRWDISTGKELETIGINLSHTLRVFWSPDGKKLAAGEWFNLNNNQNIQVWDIN